MALALIGVSHHTAPVEVRERFAYGEDELAAALRLIHGRTGVREVVLLSTCNRTEAYLHPVRAPEQLDAAAEVLGEKAGRLPRPVGAYLYRREGEAVARHLFRVASGLDSLVMGEAEIQGQVRDAWRSASDARGQAGAAGAVLGRLFESALAVGGRVRAETAVGEGAASVASVSVALARKIFGGLKGQRVLVLGAGQTGRLVVDALTREGVEGITVANRSPDRAEALAAGAGGRGVELDDLAGALADADIVVASTSAPHAVVTREILRAAHPKGPSRPILFMDIAIPRDVEPDLVDEPNVFLYNVDDLRRIVDENLEARRIAARPAEELVREAASDFAGWYASLEVTPLIRSLRSSADRTRAEELRRVLARLPGLDDEARAEVEAFSKRLLNKWLHEPTVRIRARAAEGRGPEVVAAARLLHGVDGPETPGPAGPCPHPPEQDAGST